MSAPFLDVDDPLHGAMNEVVSRGLMFAFIRNPKRAWRPMRDAEGIVHHATRLTKKEAQYTFRLADTVRAVAGCDECGSPQGQACVRKKDKQPRPNHSCRVTQARLLFEQKVLPRLDRVHQTMCSASDGFVQLVFNQANDQDVNCMSCLVVAAKQQG